MPTKKTKKFLIIVMASTRLLNIVYNRIDRTYVASLHTFSKFIFFCTLFIVVTHYHDRRHIAPLGTKELE